MTDQITLSVPLIQEGIAKNGGLPEAKLSSLQKQVDGLTDAGDDRPLRRRAIDLARSLREAGDPRSSKALMTVLKQYRPTRRDRGEKYVFKQKEPQNAEEYIAQNGPLPASLLDATTEAFSAGRAPSTATFEKRYARVIEALPDIKTDEDRAAFITRLQIGYAFYHLVKFLRRGGRRQVLKGRGGQTSSDETTKQLGTLVTDLENRIKITGFDALTKAQAEGRSIILLCAHQGFYPLLQAAMSNLNMPLLRVTKGGGQSESRHEVFKADNDDPTAFIRFMRTFKNSPHYLEIYPDGRQGSVSDQTLLGFPIQIGMGFTTIAWRAKAYATHASVLWDGETFNIVFEPAPDPLTYSDSDSYYADLVSDYLAKLEQMHLAGPENMRPPRLQQI